MAAVSSVSKPTLTFYFMFIAIVAGAVLTEGARSRNLKGERDPKAWVFGKYAGKSHDELNKALLQASQKTDITELEVLWDLGADIETRDFFGRTPLSKAAEAGSLPAIKFLLAKGAKTGTRNERGWTALHYASTHGHTDVLKELINSGVDVNALTDEGWTPLHWASAMAESENMKVLVDSGALKHIRSFDGRTARDVIGTKAFQDVSPSVLSEIERLVQ